MTTVWMNDYSLDKLVIKSYKWTYNMVRKLHKIFLHAQLDRSKCIIIQSSYIYNYN